MFSVCATGSVFMSIFSVNCVKVYGLGLRVYSVCATGSVFMSMFSANVSYFSVYIECNGRHSRCQSILLPARRGVSGA